MNKYRLINEKLDLRYKAIESHFSKEFPDLKVRKCVFVGHELVDAPERIGFHFTQQCPDSKPLKAAIKEAVETATIEAGWAGSTFYY